MFNLICEDTVAAIVDGGGIEELQTDLGGILPLFMFALHLICNQWGKRILEFVILDKKLFWF